MKLVSLTIDGQPVEVEPGQTLLQAARKLGIQIPTLCYLEQCTPNTSCLVCLVKLKNNGQGRLVPSCATVAQPGMVIESETSEVHQARRTALELLLSDHVGDCLSPCHRICPLHLDIPLMLRQIEAGRMSEAIVTVRSALPLPAVLGRLCHHPCENGCRRGTWDQPAAIRELERHAADVDLNSTQPYVPARRPITRKSIVIVGSGPTGLAAADFLLQCGHACTVVDRHPQAGGTLRSQLDDQALPRSILDQEMAQLQRLGLQLKLSVEFGTVVTLDGLQRGFDIVLLAVGPLGAGEANSFGVACTAAGIKVNAQTYQTSVPNVFAAGSAVKPVAQLVRAMAEGRAAARCIDQFLSGQEIGRARAEKTFSSMMGRVEKPEVELFVEQANPGQRYDEGCHGCAALSHPQASTEAGRCLHCDCRAVGNCELQRYAEQYGASPNRFREQRRPFEQHLQHGDIIYEPGKCILCGICVQLAEQAREPLGLTFVGRGFDVRVAAPFNRTIADGLQKVAAQCVEYCPTGALVFRDKKQPA
jgi:ferredoxin